MQELLASSPGLLIAVAVVLGLLVGSFLNVVIHRLPRMLEREWREECVELLSPAEAAASGDGPEPEEEPPYDLVRPRSRCPACGHGITALENIPVVSWLVLRGRCSACGWRIPARYPLVEIVTGVLAGAVAWRFGLSVAMGGALLLTFALVALTFIDFDAQLLPDSITQPLLWLGLAFNLGGVYTDLASAVIGAIAGYGVLWLVYQGFRLLTGREGMGHGDFKLLAVLGAWLGWQLLPVVVMLSSLVGAVVGLGLMALRGHRREVPIPFGPYLAAAGFIALLWGQEIVDAYWRFSAAPV
jgi:leader peptidase (prepilin peptidase) / N-methyltransferase